MFSDNLWITIRITKIRSNHPTVTETVSAKMEEMLKDQLSERQLSRKEVVSLAQELIESMLPSSPVVETKK